jgi:hypothetical protein
LYYSFVIVTAQVPEAILRPILNEAAKLADIPSQQLVIARAEAVVWNDGSLGRPETRNAIYTSAD